MVTGKGWEESYSGLIQGIILLPGICLKRLRKTTKYLNQDGPFCGQDSNHVYFPSSNT
jgi:hypothetical protein